MSMVDDSTKEKNEYCTTFSNQIFSSQVRFDDGDDAEETIVSTSFINES